MPDTARTVVITGASSGFGAAAVRAFADRGDRVWGTMRDADGRNAAKKADLEAYAPGIAIAEMDVTRDASVADGFAAILADGPIDILINNAGIMYIGMTEAYSVAQAHEQMDTNYFGAIRAMQAVLPSMRAAGSGLIVNTSSIAGRVSVPFSYLALADAAPGKRPTRTVVGITWGVDEVNAFTQPRQDALLKEMQLDGVLGGADA
jgi:NAD(P)-dependent dehydrogenase (short-subunit alcohol dehydrogenase family)